MVKKKKADDEKNLETFSTLEKSSVNVIFHSSQLPLDKKSRKGFQEIEKKA